MGGGDSALTCQARCWGDAVGSLSLAARLRRPAPPRPSRPSLTAAPRAPLRCRGRAGKVCARARAWGGDGGDGTGRHGRGGHAPFPPFAPSGASPPQSGRRERQRGRLLQVRRERGGRRDGDGRLVLPRAAEGEGRDVGAGAMGGGGLPAAGWLALPSRGVCGGERSGGRAPEGRGQSEGGAEGHTHTYPTHTSHTHRPRAAGGFEGTVAFRVCVRRAPEEGLAPTRGRGAGVGGVVNTHAAAETGARFVGEKLAEPKRKIRAPRRSGAKPSCRLGGSGRRDR